jgi:hypothetical protein
MNKVFHFFRNLENIEASLYFLTFQVVVFGLIVVFVHIIG